MRTEEEMYDLILKIAKEDERVRAVYMNGSRTNPNVATDIYRDYDIVFVVTETQSFLETKKWVSVFGESAIIQEPASNDFAWGMEVDTSLSYNWLMLFTDGNRIDLSIKVPSCALEHYLSDTLCIKLLDKDHMLPDIPEPNDSLYHIKRPTKQQYNGCCNEFFWCLNNVAKGIVRNQMPYAQRMYMEVVHVELDKMVEWFIAARHNFAVSTGMWGKYFETYLEPDLYKQYTKTYSDGDYGHLWDAIFTACDLFQTLAKQVADFLKCTYNTEDEEGMRRYLEMMSQQKQSEFHTYSIGQDILLALEGLGYQEPTSIQKEVIPAMLSGNNIVAKAPTGSGKTAAFGIPICEHVNWEENAPQALILEPTRELTDQVREEIFHIGRKKRIKVPALFGGFPIDKQIQSLRQKSHVVVGTPGRVMDHIRRESLILDQIAWVVLDEADLMLDMGFMEEVKTILSYLKKDCKIALFSATLRPEIQSLVEEFVQDAVLILQEQTKEQTQAITESIYAVNGEDKYKSFQKILIQANPECCMIFCGTREMVNVLFQKLRKNRIFCGMLHGEIDQKERLKTVDAFKRGCFRFLIATDVAARGIDFDDITHVINYDFPMGKETYVHRIGRTGRNGKTGNAISLVTKEELRMLRQVEEYIKRELPILECPEVMEDTKKVFWESQRKKREEKQRKGAVLNAEITRIAIGGGRKSKVRTGDVVGAICGINGICAEDIGIIDIRDSISYVEIQNGKGKQVLECLQTKPIKGKIRKVRQTRV